jgi:hypothetical protein
MADDDVYRKTARGAAEVKERRAKLSPRLRTMLILVDGTATRAKLAEDGARVGAPADFLDQLAAAGLIERVGGGAPREAKAAAAAAPADEFERFRAAKQFMNDTIVDALGIKSFFFTMKLERAAVLADLRDLAGPYREAIAKARGEDEAALLAKRLEAMLR